MIIQQDIRPNAEDPLLSVKNLRIIFGDAKKETVIVDDLSFMIEKGRTLGIVGESGSGKSVTALSLLRLIGSPPLKRISGSVIFRGQDLLTISTNTLRTIRGKEIGFIFQEPMTALNPVLTIGSQITEMIIAHEKITLKQAKERSIDLLSEVGISAPRVRMENYPHELSGGMRQRAMIAMALSCNPAILIADEPTTALDVTVQAQILELMRRLMEKRSMSILFITHDLGVIAEMSDKVLVLQNGKQVEFAPVDEIFHKPRHEYTRTLLDLLKIKDASGAAIN